MKFLTAATCALFSLNTFATVIISVETYNDQKVYSRGIGETGFFRSEYSCYAGKAEGACPILKSEAQNSRYNYERGEHGYYEIRSCTIVDKEIKLSYEQLTDYGDEMVHMNLPECSPEILAEAPGYF